MARTACGAGLTQVRAGAVASLDRPTRLMVRNDRGLLARTTLRTVDGVRVTLRVKPAGEPDVDTLKEGVTPGGGRKPVGTAAVQQTITATIDAIDMNVPSISFKGPRGWKYSTRVQDKKALSQVKVGDKVDITWTEALLVAVAAGK